MSWGTYSGIEFDEVRGEAFYEPYLESTVERIESAGVTEMSEGALIVELGDTEGIIPRNHQVRHERYSQGDRVRATTTRRGMLINALEMLQNKRDENPPKKHGNIPL